MPATITPSLRYRNAPVAIEWLCRVFGLRKNLVVPDDSGGVAHAQLSFGDGMIMLGSVRENERDALLNSRTDADVTYERAKTPAPKSLIPIKDEEYGGRSFSCRDLEGPLWTIGTYDPWKSAED